ncbi:unnamed protein product, partial [Meganyctiphanes norvegica]
DGPSMDSSVIGIFSGIRVPSSVPGPVNTTTTSAHLHFTTDNSITRTGFQLHWKPIEPPEPKGCGWGRFQCDVGYASVRCISPNELCDGYNSCMDRADERSP